MKTKMRLQKIKNHVDFKATVDDHNVHPGVIDALRHVLVKDEATELEVTGEISIDWDDYQPLITIDTVGISLGKHYLELDSSDENFDFDDLVDQMQQSEHINFHEYMAGYEDYLADLAMDR